MALYLMPASQSRVSYLANVQFLFAVANTLNLITRCAKGIYTPDLIPYTAVGFAGMLAGKQLGLRIHDRMRPDLMKMLVYAFVTLSGAILVIKQLS